MVDHLGCTIVPYRKLPTCVYLVKHSHISCDYNIDIKLHIELNSISVPVRGEP